MGKQFANVSSKYGAPMGRRSFGTLENAEGKIRVFRVNLDSGGYDDGGAYWGHHQNLYCATDGADYRQFTRANSRLAAIAELGIDRELIARPPVREFNFWTCLCGENLKNLNDKGRPLFNRLIELGFNSDKYFFVEITDTYGGEANYAWVTRHKVRASSERGALVRINRDSGLGFRSVGCNRYDSRSGATCCFIEHWDDEIHSNVKHVRTDLA